MRKNSMSHDFFIDKLEYIESCPYCNTSRFIPEIHGVEDFSFGVVSGMWSYYRCVSCSTLLLNPRIKKDFISEAYRNYYTHSVDVPLTFFSRMRVKVKNEWFSQLSEVKFEPRLSSFRFLIKLLIIIFKKNKLPFGIDYLANAKPSRFLDYGCGSGYYINIAKNLGWDSFGVDFDKDALLVAKNLGLKVFSENIDLNSLPKFDCILCSHVIEHVYDPKALLSKFSEILNPGGVLLISSPCSNSNMLRIFGKYWRGLEAPRHIAIPSISSLVQVLEKLNFDVIQVMPNKDETSHESIRFMYRGNGVGLLDIIIVKILRLFINSNEKSVDFIKLKCIKKKI